MFAFTVSSSRKTLPSRFVCFVFLGITLFSTLTFQGHHKGTLSFGQVVYTGV